MPSGLVHETALQPTSEHSCACKHPCVWWYPDVLPWSLKSQGRFDGLTELMKNSPHTTTDGECADFYLIENPNGELLREEKKETETTLAMFDRFAANYPYWNRTLETGKVRHLLFNPKSPSFLAPTCLALAFGHCHWVATLGIWKPRRQASALAPKGLYFDGAAIAYGHLAAIATGALV